MPKPTLIELGDGTTIPILYEDRSVMAIDKPAGWLLAPTEWEHTSRNLPRALESSIAGRDFWARSRNLRYLRFIHRLDAETSGVLLMAKSPGALPAYSRLFEGRQVEKVYLAVVAGIPEQQAWTCKLAVEPDPLRRGRMRVARSGERRGSIEETPEGAKAAETAFRVLRAGKISALVRVQPVTGRTHQIRVHLAAAGHPVLNDLEYGDAKDIPSGKRPKEWQLALRAIFIGYPDPFTRRAVRIEAPWDEFVKQHGFSLTRDELFGRAGRQKV